MVVAQTKADALAARLEGMSLAKEGCLAPARTEALSRLSAMGLPTKRDEYWRYTDPTSLTTATAPEAALFDDTDETAVFDAIDRLRLVFVDGVFDPGLSDDLVLAGVEICDLAKAGRADIHWARDLYGVLEARGQSPVARPLAALNTAFSTQGVMIRATAKAAKPVALIYLHKSESSDAMLHHCIKVESGAELTVLENGPGAARINQVVEVDLADGARFHHIRAQGRDHERRAVTHIFARLGAGALLKSFTLTANGQMTRNEAVIELVGAEGRAHIAGAAVGDGNFHQDDTIFVTHAAERCESRQVFKKVLKNGAVGVFQGKILVKQGAQKTDGYQISQSLLLDEDSQFLAKPELEIFADDVVCGHGATSGSIDDEHLFYLRARGIPEAEAKSLLIAAFAAEAFDEVAHEGVREALVGLTGSWLLQRK